MKKVAIIGVGLMGGSLGIALKNIKKNGKCLYDVTGIGRNEKKLKAALKKSAVDRYSTDLKSTQNADIIVICYPVNMIADTYKKLSSFVSSKTVICDIGSTKYSTDTQIKKFRKGHKTFPYFVGCHPMAGTEKGGIENADGNLYKNATVIITDLQKNKNVTAVAKMWKDAGSNIIYMSADKHDNAVAVVSHLPHIISYSFYKMFKAKNNRNSKLQNIAAGSFKSITRVAKSTADIWEPIFYSNSKNLKILINEFCKNMQSFADSFSDEKKLTKLIEESTYYENK